MTRRFLAVLALGLLGGTANAAQYAMPTALCGGRICEAMPTVSLNLDGTVNSGGSGGGSGGGSVPTGTAGSPNANVLSIQGVPNGSLLGVTGTVAVSNFPALQSVLPSAVVVTGDQSYTAGSNAQLTLTPSGRLKVGLSSAANITPAAGLATTLAADLIACTYRSGAVTYANGYTGALACNADGTLSVGMPGGVAITNLPATQAVSGAVTATISGTPTVTVGNASLAITAAALPLPAGAATAAGQSTVKAGSTLPAATDTAQVVSLRDPVLGSGGVPLQQASGNNGLIVGGAVTDGNAPTGNSIHVAGLDAGGLKRSLLTDTAGRLQIGSTTSGTVGAAAPAVAAQEAGRDASGVLRAIATDATGALVPPQAPASAITQTVTAVAASTSTVIAPASTAVIAVEIQCDGTAPVAIDRKGGALTSLASAPLVLPQTAYQLYIMPVATTSAITAWTATAQTCRVSQYARQ